MPPRRKLDEYARKRDFERTPEPAGAPADDADEASAGGASAARRRFVIQQHDATRLHWDLRLEHDGVLLSWALPRGLPWDPGRNHLAVHTEDHPLEYLTFEGDIPDGSYGAGMMTVWDQGTYEPEKIEDRKVVVVLHGGRSRGRFALFQTRGRDWIPPAATRRTGSTCSGPSRGRHPTARAGRSRPAGGGSAVPSSPAAGSSRS
jgi:bifunctional non-homologous end joining protein LigD